MFGIKLKDCFMSLLAVVIIFFAFGLAQVKEANATTNGITRVPSFTLQGTEYVKSSGSLIYTTRVNVERLELVECTNELNDKLAKTTQIVAGTRYGYTFDGGCIKAFIPVADNLL